MSMSTGMGMGMDMGMNKDRSNDIRSESPYGPSGTHLIAGAWWQWEPVLGLGMSQATQ